MEIAIMPHKGQISLDVKDERKRSLSIETMNKSFCSVLTDETLLTTAEAD